MIARKTQKIFLFVRREKRKSARALSQSVEKINLLLFPFRCYTIGYRDKIKNWIISPFLSWQIDKRKIEFPTSFVRVKTGEHRIRQTYIFTPLNVRPYMKFRGHILQSVSRIKSHGARRLFLSHFWPLSDKLHSLRYLGLLKIGWSLKPSSRKRVLTS